LPFSIGIAVPPLAQHTKFTRKSAAKFRAEKFQNFARFKISKFRRHVAHEILKNFKIPRQIKRGIFFPMQTRQNVD